MSIHMGTVENFGCADAVRCRAFLILPREAVFAAFRHDILTWWPRDATWSGDTIEDLFFEGRKGGMLWERGPDGFRIDMARVLRWVQPERIVLRWHIGPGQMPEPDPAKASEVEVYFYSDDDGGTRIEIEHRGFSRHGAGAEGYRARMGSEKGWPRILKCFADHCGRKAEPTVLGATITPLRALPELAPHL